MELRQLRHFVMLAEERHFGRAAVRLSMTQPALSSSILRLEESLNVRLLERDNKSVSLTPIGSALLVRAREMMLLAERIEQYVRAIAAGHAGILEIGFTGTMLFRGLAEILRRFGETYPQIELSSRELTSGVQLQRLHAGSLDVGFLTMPLPPPDLASFVFAQERFAACMSREHPLASEAEIDVGQLRYDVFVMLAKENSPTYYEAITGMCTNAGFHPKSHIMAAQAPSVLAMVGARLGVSLMPESIGAAQFPGVVFVPLRGETTHPTAYAAWDPRREVPGREAFLDTVREMRAAPPTAG